MTKHITLFGGPSCGKSTISSGLFYEMKKRNLDVEYCTEYAKELVYGDDNMKLKNQLLVLANQSHPWFVLQEKEIDFTINDGPFFLSVVYMKENIHIPTNDFCELVAKMFKSFDTVNYFLEPDFDYYQNKGRQQTSEESAELHNLIKSKLLEYNIPFKTIKSNDKTVQKILEDLNLS